MRSSHSNLIFNFGFNVAQVVRVFLSAVALIIDSILDVVLDTAGSRFSEIFSIFLRLMLYQYCLPGLILISLCILLSLHIPSVILLVKDLKIHNLVLDLSA